MLTKIIQYFIVLILIFCTIVKQSDAQTTTFLPNRLEPITQENAGKVKQIAMFAPDGNDLKGYNNPDLDYLAKEPSGSNHWITSVKFSSDGQQIVAGSYDTSVRTWNVASGQHLLTLIGHKEMVNDVAFSPDDSLIASGSGEYQAYEDFSIRIWEAKTGKQISTLQGHRNEVLSIAFSPDGSRIASASIDGSIRMWSVKTEEQLSVIQASDNWIRRVRFDSTGHMLLTADNDGSVKLWDSQSGKLIRTMHNPDWVFDARFSPDQTLIASASRDGTVRLWNTATGELKATYAIKTDEVDSEGDMPHPGNVAFNSSGNLLAISIGTSIQLWNIQTGKLITTLSGHTESIDDLNFNSDSTVLASASFDGTIRLWGVPVQ